MTTRAILAALALVALTAAPAAAFDALDVTGPCFGIAEAPAALPSLQELNADFEVNRACRVDLESLDVAWGEVDFATHYTIIVIAAVDDGWSLMKADKIDGTKHTLHFADANAGWYAFAVAPAFGDEYGRPSAFTIVQVIDQGPTGTPGTDDVDEEPDGTSDAGSEIEQLHAEVAALERMIEELEAELAEAYTKMDLMEAEAKERITLLEEHNEHLRRLVRELRRKLIDVLG